MSLPLVTTIAYVAKDSVTALHTLLPCTACPLMLHAILLCILHQAHVLHICCILGLFLIWAEVNAPA